MIVGNIYIYTYTVYIYVLYLYIFMFRGRTHVYTVYICVQILVSNKHQGKISDDDSIIAISYMLNLDVGEPSRDLLAFGCDFSPRLLGKTVRCGQVVGILSCLITTHGRNILMLQDYIIVT